MSNEIINDKKGPKLNNISKSLTTRDSLGIESVATSISGEICPIVNTVTPRPFYWAFIMWGFYDFYKNCKPEDRKNGNVYDYVRMQNYFLALASVISDTAVSNGFTGADTIKSRINIEQNTFSYDERYIQTQLSNMVYYPAGLYTMGLIVDENPETFEKYKYAHITPAGEKLAIAFDKVFSQTLYYQKYRKIGKDIPKEVLIELGNLIKINLEGFTEVKSILIDYLFNKERNKKLIESHNYLNYIFKTEKIDNWNAYTYRNIFYDYYSTRGLQKKKYPQELKEIIDSWEIVVGRQYFSAGLEMIWKYMLECLSVPKKTSEWFGDCLKESYFDFNIDNRLSELIPDCEFDFDEREEMISIARNDRFEHEENIQNGVKIILSIYNRFYDREDFSKENLYFYNYGADRNSISFNDFFELVNEYKDKTIKEFIVHIMNNYLLMQHLNTAFEKMLQGRDGYYIEKIDDLFVRKEFFSLFFQGIRMVQLTSVMKDLDILED